MLDDFARLRIAAGEIPPEAATVLRSADSQRTTAVPGIDKRIIDRKDFDGRLTQDYVFGPSPGTYVRSVDVRDVEIIMQSTSAHQFRIKGHPAAEIVRPPSHFVLVGEDEVTPRQLRGALSGV